MKIKKLLALFLSTGLIISLVACSGSSGSSDNSDSVESTAEEDSSSDAANNEDTTDGSSDTASEESDVLIPEEKIIASHDEGLGEWEDDFSDYAIDGEESFTWGYIDMDYGQTFTTKIRNAFLTYCEKYFPNVTVLTADGQNDANTQQDLAESFVTQGVDAIILVPCDADGCVGIVDYCTSEGIPLIVENSVVHSDHLDVDVGYVGSSNYDSGHLQGEWLVENVDDADTVNIVYQKGEEGLDHTQQRYEGIFDALDEAEYDYEILSTLNSDYMRDKALTNAEDWITSYGDEVDVVACCNDESCMGSLQAYQAADLAEGVYFLGIDANQDCMEEVKNENVSCTIFQNALGQAKWSAISAYAANVAGATETTSFPIPFETVDSTNVDDYLS